MTGWIKIHRQMLDWEWYDDQNTFRLFITLLMMANHADNRWKGQLVKKGSMITSIDKLSLKTGLSFQQVRTSLKKLISTGEITSQSTNKNRVISITNWTEYQKDNNQDDKQTTSQQQTNNKQITTNKNEKKEKNEKNDKEVLGLDFTAWQSQPSQQTLADYKKTRKAKLTQTAVNRMANEINKAVAQGMTADDCLSVCCEAGWQGFKYDWYLNREKSNEKGTRSSTTNKAQDYLDRLKAI